MNKEQEHLDTLIERCNNAIYNCEPHNGLSVVEALEHVAEVINELRDAISDLRLEIRTLNRDPDDY